MMNKQHLKIVLDLTDSCSPELKSKVERVLNYVPQSITNNHNTINYFSKSTRGKDAFNIVGKENEQTSYAGEFTGTKLTFEKNNIMHNLFICDGMYLEFIKNVFNKTGFPILQYEIVKDGVSKNYDLVIKHYENGGYSLSVYQQHNANFQNSAKEVKRSFLTEEEFENIVSENEKKIRM